jgi:hypothetical protein
VSSVCTARRVVLLELRASLASQQEAFAGLSTPWRMSGHSHHHGASADASLNLDRHSARNATIAMVVRSIDACVLVVVFTLPPSTSI